MIFVQYCITYILVPIYATWIMDCGHHKHEEINFFKKGIYHDFNSNWFMDVGQNVVEIMKFNIYMPVITFLTNWAMRYASRTWDQINLCRKHSQTENAQSENA